MQKKLWNKDFILMLQGGAVSALGDILYSVAIGYWVYEQTGSNALMGLISSISLFMTMLVMPFSGSVIDRCDRKAVIVGMDALRGILMLFIGILAFREQLNTGIVLAAAFLASLCSVFFEPAVSTLMLDIIPRPEMVRGQSIQEGISTGIGMVGKAFSGTLVVLFGVPAMISFNGLSYLLSALTEIFITVPKREVQETRVTAGTVFQDFSAAVRSSLSDRFLRLFGPSSLCINLLAAGPMMLRLPFVLEKGFSVETYGLLASVETAASLLAVLFLSMVKLKPKGRYMTMCGGFVSTVLFAISGYLTTERNLICTCLFFSGFACTLGNSIFNAEMMLALPQENRGGILGLIGAVSMGGGALSTLIFGFLCDLFPLTAVFTGGTLLSLIPMIHLCGHRTTKEFMLRNE